MVCVKSTNYCPHVFLNSDTLAPLKADQSYSLFMHGSSALRCLATNSLWKTSHFSFQSLDPSPTATILNMDATSDYPCRIPSLAITYSLPSNPRPLTQNNASSTCLEGLPYDVRHLILSFVPTIADLLAILRASPVFYRLCYRA